MSQQVEKGSSFAARRQLLPPYDTTATMARGDRDNISALQRGRAWIWITSNHDPEPAARIPGCVNHRRLNLPPSSARRRRRNFRASHPVALVAHRGRVVIRRCFAADVARMVMPAFSAYTGGINMRDALFADVFDRLNFTTHMLGENRLYAFAAKRCVRD